MHEGGPSQKVRGPKRRAVPPIGEFVEIRGNYLKTFRITIIKPEQSKNDNKNLYMLFGSLLEFITNILNIIFVL